MFKSHLLLLILASALISIVIGLITKETPGEKKKFIVIMFLSLVGFCVVTAWIMYFVHS